MRLILLLSLILPSLSNAQTLNLQISSPGSYSGENYSGWYGDEGGYVPSESLNESDYSRLNDERAARELAARERYLNSPAAAEERRKRILNDISTSGLLSHSQADKAAVSASIPGFVESHNKSVAEALTNLPSLTHVLDQRTAEYPFYTPRYTLEGGELEKLNNYKNYAQNLVNQDSSDSKASRQNLVDFADLSLAAGDRNFQAGNYTEGWFNLNTARQILNIAVDFTPGLSMAKDVISLTTGVNPVTGEELSELDMAFTATTLLLPSVASASGKVFAKTARLLTEIAKDSKYATRSEELVKAIRESDDLFVKAADCLTENIPIWQRALDFLLGVNTAWATPPCKQVGEVLDEVVDSARKIGLKTGEEIEHNIGVVERWKSSFSKTSIDNAESVNKELAEIGYSKPPYTEGSEVISFKPQEPTDFIRVHGETNQGGRWVMNRDDIKGLNPTQIKEKFALPDVPTKVSDVTVPAGTGMRMGPVAPNYGSQGGGIQFEVLERVEFRNARPIGEL